MKSAGRFERDMERAGRVRRLLALAAGSAMAIAYCLAAQQDEKNGFPLTAAMEWRKAAELFAPMSLLSDRCWSEWERIVQLPRRFAAPIADSDEIVLQFSPRIGHGLGDRFCTSNGCITHFRPILATIPKLIFSPRLLSARPR